MTPLQEWLKDHNRKLTQDAIDEALLEYIEMIEEYIALVEKERDEAYEAGRAAAMEPASEEVKDAVQWISVEDRLPDLDTDVMVYPYPAYQVMTARFGFIQKKDIAPCWHFSEYILNYGWKEQEVDPTHWMPLPKTPVEEGEK